jgi:hypothetical protein
MPTTGKNASIGDFESAATQRLVTSRRESMSARLARVHVLCKQMSAIKGAAKAN